MAASDEDLTALFNRLSAGDQRKLKIASTTNAVVDDACADSIRHPWKYPLYTLYIAAMMLPTPGIHTFVMAGLLVGWAKLGWTRGAREQDERIRQAVEPPALMKTFAKCVEDGENGGPVVKNGALFMSVLRHGKNQLIDAGRQIFSRHGDSGQGPNPS